MDATVPENGEAIEDSSVSSETSEECIIETVFASCNTDQAGLVCVSLLIERIHCIASQHSPVVCDFQYIFINEQAISLFCRLCMKVLNMFLCIISFIALLGENGVHMSDNLIQCMLCR